VGRRSAAAAAAAAECRQCHFAGGYGDIYAVDMGTPMGIPMVMGMGIEIPSPWQPCHFVS